MIGPYLEGPTTEIWASRFAVLQRCTSNRLTHLPCENVYVLGSCWKIPLMRVVRQRNLYHYGSRRARRSSFIVLKHYSKNQKHKLASSTKYLRRQVTTSDGLYHCRYMLGTSWRYCSKIWIGRICWLSDEGWKSNSVLLKFIRQLWYSWKKASAKPTQRLRDRREREAAFAVADDDFR